MTRVQKLGWIYGLRKQNGLSCAAYICSMPYKALYGCAWVYVQTSTCYSQRFHIPTEMKPVFITKQSECGFCAPVCPVKVPVLCSCVPCQGTSFVLLCALSRYQFTKFGFVLQLASYSVWTLFVLCDSRCSSSCVAGLGSHTDTLIGFSGHAKNFHGNGFNFVHFFLSYLLPSVFFFSPKSNILSETFSLIYNSFHCVQWVQGAFSLLNLQIHFL